jgi:aryl carrier-like protein
MDEEHRLLPPGASGEIVIHGDNVTAGYVDLPEADSDAFLSGWFRTGDLGFIDPAGYLYLTGRLKEIINRGGEKVSPAEVDEALLEHAAVRAAATFGVHHPTLGQDVAAAVVLKDGAKATADEIRASLFGRLAEFRIPSRLVVVDAIPVSATGKIRRAGLAERLARQLQPSHVAPRDATELDVASMFREILGVTPVGALDNFFALGGDSLRGFQLLTRIRTRMHVDVSILDLFKEPTVARLAAVIGRNRQEAERATLERIISEVESISEQEAGRLARGDAIDS